jgi:diguanylate cyclase (GGDEF)-like protein
LPLDQPVRPSRDRFWHAHLELGFAVLAGEAGATIGYIAASPTGPARAQLRIIGACVAALAVVGLLLSRWIARLAWRERLLAVTSTATIAVLAVCAHLDGGLESPLLFLSVMPVVYVGLFASPRLVGFCGAVSIASVAVVGLTDPDVELPQESLLMLTAVVAGVVILTISSSIHRDRLHNAHAVLVGELFRRGQTDELTGCSNHRAFYERLADEIDRAIRYGRPLCLIVGDVDQFRAYNDQFGHDHGDTTLAAVGAHLRTYARSSDIVARIGGDEFAVLLPETTLDEATVVARRIVRGAVDDAILPTISAGVAPLRADEPTARRLFRDADQAMYAAKKAGRSRAVAATEEFRHRLTLVPASSIIDEDRSRDADAYQELQRESNETEVLLGMLVREAAVGLAFIDCDGRLLRINDALAQINESQSAAQVGQPIGQLGPRLWPHLHAAYREVLATGHAVRNVEVAQQASPDDMAAGAWLATLFPVHIADRLLGVGLAVLDITDRKLLERSAEALTESVIQALAATTEARDPYTAGHQRRVSDISTDIATRLGLSPYEIRGVALAAAIHDIGKVAIPAEILSRPGKLTEPEMQLVRTHAMAGYNILRDIPFPWPVAQMVRQHHERLDGSGYPDGLRGDEILLSSRIIAVADVVEAMSAHRPYRPSLGVQHALDQIKAGRGITFDEAVVDACIEVFRNSENEAPTNAA